MTYLSYIQIKNLNKINCLLFCEIEIFPLKFFKKEFYILAKIFEKYYKVLINKKNRFIPNLLIL